MKIWVINQYAVPTSLPGITRHFELIDEWVNSQSLDVIIWLSSFNYSLRRYLSKDERTQIDRNHPEITIKWCWAFPHKKNNWKRVVNMLSFSIIFSLKALFKKKPDVIIASSPQIFVTYVALLIAKLFKVPFVLEVRDLWPESLIAMNKRKQGSMAKFLFNIEASLYNNAEHIIVLTQYQKDYISKKGISSNKIDLIPNGVVVEKQIEITKETIDEVRRKIGVSKEAYVAIYTGAHGNANALESVVRAAKFLGKDEYIVLIGDGPDKPNLLKIKEKDDLQQVIFLEPVPKTEIIKYTAAADCGIISLENNDVFKGARPNKLFDYMSLGKPVLSTIGGEIGFILSTNKVGWVVPDNVAPDVGLARLIQSTRRMPALEKEKIRENGEVYIKNEGNRRKSASKFLSIINGIKSDIKTQN
ncbi:glycosyltransferase family 4 protein [Parapedobacter deserti]|uniref:Glycosyltransferase family 4 protein n=1 Tax=Parapedobacter deserti TaxID=1912957 RepID=A0ABV7JJ23_9SPHI